MSPVPLASCAKAQPAKREERLSGRMLEVERRMLIAQLYDEKYDFVTELMDT